jgi:hypothetical protein
MDLSDKKTSKKAGGKMPSSPIKAPQGNIKGIGKLGEYTGGLDPLVVKPTPGISPRRMAPTIFRGYNMDSRQMKGRGRM